MLSLEFGTEARCIGNAVWSVLDASKEETVAMGPGGRPRVVAYTGTPNMKVVKGQYTKRETASTWSGKVETIERDTVRYDWNMSDDLLDRMDHDAVHFVDFGPKRGLMQGSDFFREEERYEFEENIRRIVEPLDTFEGFTCLVELDTPYVNLAATAMGVIRDEFPHHPIHAHALYDAQSRCFSTAFASIWEHASVVAPLAYEEDAATTASIVLQELMPMLHCHERRTLSSFTSDLLLKPSCKMATIWSSSGQDVHNKSSTEEFREDRIFSSVYILPDTDSASCLSKQLSRSSFQRFSAPVEYRSTHLPVSNLGVCVEISRATPIHIVQEHLMPRHKKSGSFSVDDTEAISTLQGIMEDYKHD